MQNKYSIGIDFGTLSGRAILLDAISGEELAESVYEYPHGVMDEVLPCGKKLEANFALQHPSDYEEVLSHTIPDVMAKSRVNPAEICGVAIDFTASTVVAVDETFVPLCLRDEFKDNPHAYVKLWKHHGAQKEADKLNELAKLRQEPWLSIYGGKVSSEFMLPKIMETLNKAPEVYDATFRFIEAGDYVNFLLTGKESHSAIFAGLKACWNSRTGFPSSEFLGELNPKLSDIISTKISDNISPAGSICGYVDERGSKLTGLPVGIPVATAMIDAHAAMPALGLSGSGDLMIVMGTSSCHIMNGPSECEIPGLFGYVRDGIYPGFVTFEAGQSAVGDIFQWFVENQVPGAYERTASEKGISVYQYLESLAIKLAPGENGLVALDWFNGNRSILSDSNLSGLILGLTLRTKPEEIYRALLESTAYGTRIILDAFAKAGVSVNKIVATGGIATKSPLMMQIYADVLGKEIHIMNTKQAGARGSAIFASAVGGVYKTPNEATDKLKVAEFTCYKPIPENAEKYEKLFAEYQKLHDYFGRGENDVMKRLRNI